MREPWTFVRSRVTVSGWWRRNETRAFVAVGVFLLFATLTCVALVLVRHGRSLSALSGWLPASVTATTLAYTLLSQRRMQVERELEPARRAAEKVHAWIDDPGVIELPTFDFTLAWSNLSDAPVYEVEVYVSDERGNSPRVVELGVVRPNTHGDTMTLSWTPSPHEEEDSPFGDFRLGARAAFIVEMSFFDGSRNRWTRARNGFLRGTSARDLPDSMHPGGDGVFPIMPLRDEMSPLAYKRPLRRRR
jgi:hypothetical protein